MSLTAVRSALAKAFIDPAFFPLDKIRWENALFVTPKNTPWAGFLFRPSPISVASLGIAGQDKVEGYAQIDLNYPLNTGESDGLVMFEAIRALFKAGASFTYDGQAVRIVNTSRGPGIEFGAYYRTPITITFYSHLIR